MSEEDEICSYRWEKLHLPASLEEEEGDLLFQQAKNTTADRLALRICEEATSHFLPLPLLFPPLLLPSLNHSPPPLFLPV